MRVSTKSKLSWGAGGLGLGLAGLVLALLLLPADTANAPRTTKANEVRVAGASPIAPVVPSSEPIVFVRPVIRTAEPTPPKPVFSAWPNWPIAPASTPVTGKLTAAQIGASDVNVRSGPDANAAKLFVLNAGEAIQVAETTGGWAHVVGPDGQSGWVYGRYLAGAQPAPAAAAAPVEERTASLAGRTFRLNARAAVMAGPSADASEIYELPAGEQVEIAESRGRWVRIITDSDESGWIAIRR